MLFMAWVQILKTPTSILLFLMRKGLISPPKNCLQLRALNSSEYQIKTIEFLTLKLLYGIFFMSVHVRAKFAIVISKMYQK